jgi:hypothetical protein
VEWAKGAGVSSGKTGVVSIGWGGRPLFFENRVEAVFATYWQVIVVFKGQEHLFT